MISTFEYFLPFLGVASRAGRPHGFRLAFAPGAPVRTGKDPPVHSSVAQSNLRKTRPVFNASSRRVLGASSASPIRQGLGQSPTTCSARSGRAPRLPLRCTPPTGASSTPGLMLISLSLKKLASYCRTTLSASQGKSGRLSVTHRGFSCCCARHRLNTLAVKQVQPVQHGMWVIDNSPPSSRFTQSWGRCNSRLRPWS